MGDSGGKRRSGEEKKREKLVILGSGWAAISLFQHIDLDKYDVVIVSPRNYFLFTPLLPGATVGTLAGSSLAQSVRNIVHQRDPDGTAVQYFEAACTDVDFANKRIHCSDVSEYREPDCSEFDLEYDKLVIAVGATNSTFGVPGVEKHAFFLKNLEDAQRIRERLIDVLESNSLPSSSATRELNFCIVGGGPVGVEFGAELFDFIEEDVRRLFPKSKVRPRIIIIEALDHLLSTYSAEISDYVQKKFERRGYIMDVMTNAQVVEVKDRSIVIRNRKTGELTEIDSQFTCWATGIATNDLAKKTVQYIGEKYQKNARAITVDDRLRVKGARDVYALGDCATVEKKLMLDRMVELFDSIDTDHDGRFSLEELAEMFKRKEREFPQIRAFGSKLFSATDLHAFLIEQQKKNQQLRIPIPTKEDALALKLTREEFKQLLQAVDTRVANLPPTAQVAQQEGRYLAASLNKLADLAEKHAEKDEISDDAIPPFEWKNLGSMAYIGQNESVADLTFPKVTSTGWSTWVLWRGVYFSRQVSLRARLSIATDWLQAHIFGRDPSRHM